MTTDAATVVIEHVRDVTSDQSSDVILHVCVSTLIVSSEGFFPCCRPLLPSLSIRVNPWCPRVCVILISASILLIRTLECGFFNHVAAAAERAHGPLRGAMSVMNYPARF